MENRDLASINRVSIDDHGDGICEVNNGEFFLRKNHFNKSKIL